MNPFRWFQHHFLGGTKDDTAWTIDHVRTAPAKAKKKAPKKDWRDKAIEAAAKTHGKPFKAGPEFVRREVLIGGEAVAVDAGALPHAVPPSNVAPITQKRKS